MTAMNCQICQRPGAQNYYGIAVLNGGTFVTNARWGAEPFAAYERAKDAAREFVGPDDFAYNIDVVVAHNRREVVKAYYAE